ncbi:hypothetical protein ACH5RR_012014 [Cinchona calisaya]|uniref:Transmembrane protein n=1 Tax=Cinchona calisaya TaxID=153742 RepID=A0ABD3ACF3_9GENT
MATSTFSLFLLSLSLFTLTASSRPCKTLFFYTTTSSSSSASAVPQNPLNFEIFPSQNSHSYNSPKFLTFFLTTQESHPRVSYFSLRRTPFVLSYSSSRQQEQQKFLHDEAAAAAVDRRSVSDDESMMPFGIYSSSVTTSSIRDRTKDIMSVVGALLFGVGCGALTAATMFLIWSLFSPHRFDFDDSDDSDGYADVDDDVSPKKVGYIAIPEDVDAIKKGFAAQKEVA